jgi:hypothetical protein
MMILERDTRSRVKESPELSGVIESCTINLFTLAA